MVKCNPAYRALLKGLAQFIVICKLKKIKYRELDSCKPWNTAASFLKIYDDMK